MQASKLLLFSRDPERLRSLRESLEPLAGEMLTSNASAVAGELCRSHQICAVLMDLDPNSPEAIEAAECIRAEDGSHRAPILYLGGDGEVPEAIKRKLEGYLSRDRPSASVRELELSVGELTRANEALHDFTWAASHDLKEPLRGIVVLTDRLIRSAESKLDVNERETLNLIRENGVRTMRLIDAMQQYIYVGEAAEPVLAKVDLNAILRNVLSQLKELISQNSACVSWRHLPVIYSSETMLTQIFQNLVDNAIKYRSTDPPSVRISCEPGVGQWVISVEDNGIGIDPAYREYIFEPFKRLQGKKLAGSGIGLAICRSAVRRLGGSIWVEAGARRGSIFRFMLPEARADEDQVHTAEQKHLEIA